MVEGELGRSERPGRVIREAGGGSVTSQGVARKGFASRPLLR
jgi:hypothetical protein